MDLELVSLDSYPSYKFIQAFQVVSFEDPYHPQDIGFARDYSKAVEMAEEYDEERSTMMYGGRGIKIYEILIRL